MTTINLFVFFNSPYFIFYFSLNNFDLAFEMGMTDSRCQ